MTIILDDDGKRHRSTVMVCTGVTDMCAWASSALLQSIDLTNDVWCVPDQLYQRVSAYGDDFPNFVPLEKRAPP